MNRNLIITLNVAWAGIAVGAYMFGRSDSGTEKGADDTRNVTTAVNGRQAVGVTGGGAGSGSEAGFSRSGSPSWDGGIPDAERMGKLFSRAFKEQNPIVRKQLLGNLLASLTLENLPAALKAFEEGPRDDETDRAFRDFLYAWGALDGPAAIAYAMDKESARKSRYGSIGVMTGWASTDLRAAQDYVAGRENDDTKTWLHYGVFKAVLDRDLDMAIEYAADNTKSRARGYAMDRLASKLKQSGGADALKNWLDGIDHTGENDMESYKSYALRVAIDRIGRDDPEMATAWIEENLGQPYVNFETLRRAAWAVSGGDAGESMDWLTALPQSDDRKRAFGEIVEHHANRNPNAVAEWLNARKDVPEFDSAASVFAQEIVDDDPVSAIAWAQSIREEGRRDKTLKKVIKSWQKADPAAAEVWIRENS